MREYNPEVVLLDIGLPGMDGYEVARCLRSEMGDDAPMLVAMTGYSQHEVSRHARQGRVRSSSGEASRYGSTAGIADTNQMTLSAVLLEMERRISAVVG